MAETIVFAHIRMQKKQLQLQFIFYATYKNQIDYSSKCKTLNYKTSNLGQRYLRYENKGTIHRGKT